MSWSIFANGAKSVVEKKVREHKPKCAQEHAACNLILGELQRGTDGTTSVIRDGAWVQVPFNSVKLECAGHGSPSSEDWNEPSKYSDDAHRSGNLRISIEWFYYDNGE